MTEFDKTKAHQPSFLSSINYQMLKQSFVTKQKYF